MCSFADADADADVDLARGADETKTDWLERLCEHMLAAARDGALPRVESYLQAAPELAADEQSVLELIAMERRLRCEVGEPAALESTLARFPGHREAIREQFELDEALDGLSEFACAAGRAPEWPVLVAPGEPPRLESRYCVGPKLGQGGFGSVWHAHDRKLDRPVAIKVLNEQADLRSLAFLRREAHMVARVNHPNVVAIYEVELDHLPPYLVLEYVDGATLRATLRGSGGHLEVGEAIRITRAVADGCLSFHRLDIVLRDLKPENIIIGSGGRVRILDLGMARPLGDPDAHLTAEDCIPGTAQYLSPERLGGSGAPIGAASDQFTLGVIFYEMLAGRRPFDVDDDPPHFRTMRQIQECPPPRPLDELRDDVDAELASIVAQMLRKAPDERFESMGEVVAVLDGYLECRRDQGRIRLDPPDDPPTRPDNDPTGKRGEVSDWRRPLGFGAIVAPPIEEPRRRLSARTSRGMVAALAPLVVLIVVVCMSAPTRSDRSSPSLPLTSSLPPTPPVTPPPAPVPLSFAGLLALIRDDIDRHVAEADRPSCRYFTLAHLATDPDVGPDLLRRHRDALAQLLATLTVGNPVAPVPIDPDELVFRVDLRALGCADDEGRRELHLKNPYALQCTADDAEAGLRDLADDVKRRLGEQEHRLPVYLRVDWFFVTFTAPARARSLLERADTTSDEVDARLARIAALRLGYADLLALYERPLDLAAASRELGMADPAPVRAAILTIIADRGDDGLGLGPLTEGGAVGRDVWSHNDISHTTFGEVCRQLKQGRRFRGRND